MSRGEALEEAPTSCTGRFGLAFSQDGKNFRTELQPTFVPDSPFEGRGVERPRLHRIGGVFILTYTGYDGFKNTLCLATSTDMRNWFRHGPVFPNSDLNGGQTNCGVICDQPLADGRYVMYFGAGDIHMATSSDLVTWDLHKKPVWKRKKTGFTSYWLEPGPAPLMTKHGIVLIANATDERNRVTVTAGVFDSEDPTKLTSQLTEPFLTPSQDWERFGYLPNITHASGLVQNGDTLQLYYGAADRRVGLAEAKLPKNYLTAPVSPEEAEKETPKICGV